MATNAKEGRVRKNTTWVQPGDLVNTKCLFFLDVGRMPVAPRDSIHLFIWGFTSLSTLYRSYHDG